MVDEAAALADLVEQRRAHALAEHRRSHRTGVVVALHRRDREAENQVRLAAARHLLRRHAANVLRRRHPVLAAARHRTERGVDVARHRAGIDPPGHRDDDVGAGVLLAHVVDQLRAGEALDVASIADHRPRHRVLAEAGFVEQREGRRQRVVFVFGELLQDDLAFARQLGIGEGAALHDVAQHADQRSAVLPQAVHVEGGVVLVGVRVDLGAEPLGIEVDALAVAAFGAFERHVLDDVADAVLRRAFMLAAAAHEHADLDGFELRRFDGDDAHAVGKGGDAGVGVAGEVGHGWQGVSAASRLSRVAACAAPMRVPPTSARAAGRARHGRATAGGRCRGRAIGGRQRSPACGAGRGGGRARCRR